nr:hypothetical protein [Armatimonadota bacterium]
GDMSANYNGYWIWRDLRGKMVDVKTTVLPGAQSHVHVLASNTDNGQKVTVVAYYDTGYFSPVGRAATATFSLKIKLPPGHYKSRQSSADWHTRNVTDVPGTAEGTTTATVTLAPCAAASFTWVRQ